MPTSGAERGGLRVGQVVIVVVLVVLVEGLEKVSWRRAMRDGVVGVKASFVSAESGEVRC